MLENPWSAVRSTTCALGPLGSNFGPSSLAPVGIHRLLLSNLTTVPNNVKGVRIYVTENGFFKTKDFGILSRH